MRVIDNRYQLTEIIGEGSFGEVWRAIDKETGEEKAIKICVSLDRKGQDDFMKEYELASSLHHQNLLAIDCYGVWEKQPYLVMKYLPNGSATDLIGKITPCEKDEKTIWKFIYEVANGLEYLHGISPEPIVHQDIKPANILIDEDGHFVISDFGISKKLRDTMRTQSKRGNTAGAAAYMAPERFSPHPPSIMASDIWSLGASIYELAEGVLPFGGMGGGVQNNGLKVPHLSKGWSKELDKIVRSCLALKPYDRKRACEIKEIAYNILHPVPIMSIREKIETNWKHISHNRKYVFAVIVLIFAMTSLLYMSNSCRESIIIEPPITDVEKERLIYLADLLDSIQPDEVGALFDNVLYYKKDTSVFFVDSVGMPIAGGKAFDDFKRENGVVKTIRKVITTEQPVERNKANILGEITKGSKKHKEYYGLISRNGKELLPCDNDKIEIYSFGVYSYNRQSLWGCVNDSSEILKCHYKMIEYGGVSGLLLCQDTIGHYTFRDSLGKCVLPKGDAVYYGAKRFSYDYALVKDSQKGKYFFIDKNGEKVYSSEYLSLDDSFVYRVAKVSQLKGTQRLYGLMDLSFNDDPLLLPCKYEEIALDWYTGIGKNAVVVKENGQWKVINFNQEVILNLSNKYDVKMLHNSTMITKDGCLYYNNNKTQYKISDWMSHGNTIRCKINDSYHIVTKSGNISDPYSVCDYYEQAKVYKVSKANNKNTYSADNDISVSKDTKKKGNVIRITISHSSRYGIVDEELRTLVGFEYYIIGGYGNGLFVAKRNSNSLYGYIDKNGNNKIQEKFDDAYAFIDGYAVVKYDGKYGVIDINGQFQISNKYDYIYEKKERNDLFHSDYILLGGKKGLFVVKKDSLYGIVDASTQKEVVPCKYINKFEYVSNNRFPILKNGKWGFYTSDGRSTLELNKRMTMKQGNQAH